MLTKRLRVKGKVQGVGFRYHTKLKASELNILGTVQNQDDGSVLIEAQGEKEKMEHFIQWCKKGPAMAEVSELLKEEINSNLFAEFKIIRR